MGFPIVEKYVLKYKNEIVGLNNVSLQFNN
jgi:hypothetical protein